MGDFSDIERLVGKRTASHHPTDVRRFWCELGITTARWNPSYHPFFVRWSEGDLALRELQLYAAEHDRLLAASATAIMAAADKASDLLLTEVLRPLVERVNEDAARWLAFARELGWRGMSAWHYAADPFTATIECARSWAVPDRPLAADLITLYAVEALQSQVAEAGLQGLTRFYGLGHGSGADYFRRHRSLRQLSLLRSAIQGILAGSDPFALVCQADAICRSYWQVLDAVERFERTWP